MARGKQLDNETVYKIMASYYATNNYTETARQLGLAKTTVFDIVEKNKDKEEFVQLRTKIQNKFSEKFENILNKAINRLDKELDEQTTIPVNQLSTVIGTIYDKNRLENNESTENTTQTIKIGFSEELEELSK